MSFGSANNQQKTSMNDLNQGAKVGLDTSSAASGTGFNFLNQGGANLQPAADYYGSILRGGPDATAALAPDVNRTRNAAEESRNAAATLAPRGGGRASILFGQPLQEESQIQSIFNTARPQAAQGLESVGATQGQLGASALGTGANYLSPAVSAGKYGFDAGTTQYGQQQGFGSALGGAAGGIFQELLPLLLG